MLLHKLSGKLSLFCLLELLAALSAQAEDAVDGKDEILLTNGSRLIGEVVNSRDGRVKIKTDFAGTLSVKLDQVVSVNTEAPVVVLMEDKTVVKGDSLEIKEEKQVLAETGQSYPLEQLSVVNPQPWELGQGYRWTGLLGAALQPERGNSDSDELDYTVDSVWRCTHRATTSAKIRRCISTS